MNFSQSRIKHLIVHEVGNKLRDEKVFLSDHLLKIDTKLEKTLLTYFLKPFSKESDKFSFSNSANLSFNEMYSFTKAILQKPDSSTFIEATKNIANHLYEFSLHPRIINGELIIAQIENVIYEGNSIDLLGIFKSENKHDFLKVLKNTSSKEINLKKESGIDLLRHEKGCLVININEGNGFEVLNIDRQNQITDYWINKFLSIKKLKNNSQKTKEIISLCKTFSEKHLLDKYDANTSISFNNDFISYFEKNETFDFVSFETSVLETPQIKKAFVDFYEQSNVSDDLNLQETFQLSKKDLNQEKKKIRNTIKLDTNIELNMSLGSDESLKNIEKGYDEKKGMFFYKVYFHNEVK